MKKAIVLLLALAVLGGAVFAQDAAIKFSGYLDTGIAVFTEGDADPTVGLWGDDSGTASRFNLAASYTNGNVGAYARYRVQGDFDSTANVFLNRGYAWAEILDGKVKTVVGKLGDYTWSTIANDFGAFDAKTGFQVQVKPIEGLNFGVILPAASAATAVLEDAFGDMVIGAAYDLEGIGNFRAGVNLGLDAAVTDALGGAMDDAKTTSAWFGAEITAVENFVFYVDYLGSNLGQDEFGFVDYTDPDADVIYGTHYFFEEVDYTMDALNVGIDLEQQLSSVEDMPLFLSFGPYASYTMDKIVLGGAFTYLMATETDAIESMNGMYFNPYVKYLPSDVATIELGAKINTGDIDGADSAITDTTGRYYLTYTWSF